MGPPGLWGPIEGGPPERQASDRGGDDDDAAAAAAMAHQQQQQLLLLLLLHQPFDDAGILLLGTFSLVCLDIEFDHPLNDRLTELLLFRQKTDRCNDDDDGAQDMRVLIQLLNEISSLTGADTKSSQAKKETEETEETISSEGGPLLPFLGFRVKIYISREEGVQVRALRSIEEGEEVVVSYIDETLPLHDRQRLLNEATEALLLLMKAPECSNEIQLEVLLLPMRCCSHCHLHSSCCRRRSCGVLFLPAADAAVDVAELRAVAAAAFVAAVACWCYRSYLLLLYLPSSTKAHKSIQFASLQQQQQQQQKQQHQQQLLQQQQQKRELTTLVISRQLLTSLCLASQSSSSTSSNSNSGYCNSNNSPAATAATGAATAAAL
ncbi:hypothetical protein ACSSS7_005974 [Eimeria intestinalis]